MNTKNFVTRSQYTSTDWRDMATVETQMKQNGKYEIAAPEEFIASTILEELKKHNEHLTIEDIKKAINASDDGYFDVYSDGKKIDGTRIEIFSKNHSGFGYQMHYDEFDYTYLVQYYVSEIPEENVSYIVSEHIVNPGKGCDLLERIYHEPFGALSEAEAYMKEKMKDYKHEGSAYRKDSGYKISVVDKHNILKKAWYKDNMLAIKLMQELGENEEDYRFYIAHGLVSVLQKKIYEQADKQKKLEIDLKVYRSIREYLTGAQTEILDTELDKAEKIADYPSRPVADKAIILVFANASSQIDYDIRREKLGEHECRIAQLTRAGRQWVCISKHGEIGYYENGYGISAWERAKDNPYFGKLCHVFSGEADVFEKFDNHHMFVDELPTQELVDFYNEKYLAWEEENKEPFS